jgi:hypothetical protein
VSAHADGHHGGAGEHQHDDHTYGTPPGAYPVLARATRARRAQARRLWRASLRAARERFPSYRAVWRLGYRRFNEKWRKPLIFHMRRSSYDHDGRWLDPRRPESLVYWWPVRGKPVLVAFMYRYPAGRRPRFGAPLFGWHTHGPDTDNQMTHVWITRTLRTALANCLPVPALEAANRRFRWSRPGHGGGHNTQRCPEEG